MIPGPLWEWYILFPCLKGFSVTFKSSVEEQWKSERVVESESSMEYMEMNDSAVIISFDYLVQIYKQVHQK